VVGRRQKSFALKSCEGYREPAHCQADSNWPIVPDWALRRCTTGFMLSHKLSVSQCSHLALAQRHCGCPRPSPGPAPPSVRVNCPLLRTDTFFFCAVIGGGCRAALGPDLLAARARAALCFQADGSGPTLQPRSPRCSRWRRAVQVRCRCATRPRRSALVDSGACSIRSGARVQLGMRKGDHDIVHGLACMRGCSLVVQRVDCGSIFKNRV
jgi:hypothetical protein